ILKDFFHLSIHVPGISRPFLPLPPKKDQSQKDWSWCFCLTGGYSSPSFRSGADWLGFTLSCGHADASCPPTRPAIRSEFSISCPKPYRHKEATQAMREPKKIYRRPRITA